MRAGTSANADQAFDVGAAARPLRVLHAVPVWLPRTSTWLFNQVKHLPRHVTNHVACRETAHLDQFAIDNIYPLKQPFPWPWFSRWRTSPSMVEAFVAHVSRMARRFRTDVLHSHWGHYAYRNLDALQEHRMAHVVTFYGKDVGYLPMSDPVWRVRYRKLFRQTDLVLCEGPHMAQCIRALECPEEKVDVQRLGIDVDHIAYQPRAWSRGDPFRVLIAATFRQKKGIPDALQALGCIRGDVDALEITIIGDASDDDRSQREKQTILQTLHGCGLQDCTRLLGYQPHAVLLEEAYRHHLFLSPSLTADDGDTEGGAPVTLIEMAATGMPIVSTTHCDIPSVVLHGRTGLLAPERSPTILAEQIRWLLEGPDTWRPMLDAARLHIEQNFNVVRQARRLAELYAEVCGRR
ncbi:MAG: glycosyltransferase [Planctomycetia bacterium]|nr:glycosyltransferase [Planctomycetia bacterium]